MPNMSYCRFHNTLGDLQDCRDALSDYEDTIHDRLRMKKIEEEILEIETRPTMGFTEAEEDQLEDLHEELDALKDAETNISEEERGKARALIDLCREIADEFTDTDLS